MGRDEGRQWLLELTQSITRGLEASREDRAKLWDAVTTIREQHMNCREHVLKSIGDLDKRTEVIAIKVGFYVSIIASAIGIVAEHIVKEFFK